MYITEKYFENEFYLNEGIFSTDLADIECNCYPLNNRGELWKFFNPNGLKETTTIIANPENIILPGGSSEGRPYFMTKNIANRLPVDSFIFDGNFNIVKNVLMTNIRNSKRFPEGSIIKISSNIPKNMVKMLIAGAVGYAGMMMFEKLLDRFVTIENMYFKTALVGIPGGLGIAGLVTKNMERLKFKFERIK